MYYAEFIGVPGSGKSTIRESFLKAVRHKHADIPCVGSEDAYLRAARRRIDRPFRVVLNCLPDRMASRLLTRIGMRSHFRYQAVRGFLERHGRALQPFLDSAAFKRMSRSDRDMVIGAFLEAGSFYQAIHDGDGEAQLVVFDEGLLQKSMMFVLDTSLPEDHEERMTQYVNFSPMPDIIFYVTADRAQCLERMRTRPRGLTERLRRSNSDGVSRFLENAEIHMKGLIGRISGMGGTQVVTVHNENDVEETVEKMMISFAAAWNLPSGAGRGKRSGR